MLPSNKDEKVNKTRIIMNHSPTPQFHTIVKQNVEHMKGLAIPVLYLNTPNGITRMESLIEYFISNPSASYQWMQNRARAVGLFFDYCRASEGFVNYHSPNAHRTIFKLFSWALLNGTIDNETATDKLKLYWPSSSLDVSKRLCSAILDFEEYCDNEDIINTPLLKNNKIIKPIDEMASLKFLHTAIKIKKRTFLGHLKKASKLAIKLKNNKSKNISNLGNSGSRSRTSSEEKRFPEELIAPLFDYGFIKDPNAQLLSDQEDITAKMITLLLFFGGIRESEPFHLWINDVTPVDIKSYDDCQVFLRHPSEASTFMAGENVSRKEYLAQRGMLPRYRHPIKSLRANWKDLALDDSLSAPVFFMHDGAAKLFNAMYIYYINHYRPKLEEIAKSNGNPKHPFLFVSAGVDHSTGKSYQGLPYSVGAYISAFERALDKVEIALGITIPRGKEYGTTPYGSRHYYLGTLTDLGMPRKVIQKCAKHHSILSQEAYNTPAYDEIQKKLNEARGALYIKPRLDFLNKPFNT